MAEPLLDLRSLQVFAAVCERGNMTEAARALRVTQSAISQHIRQIETRIGAVVVDRTLRPMRPTPAGAILYDRAKRILAELATASASARLAGAMHLPELRIGLNSMLCGAFLSHLAIALSPPGRLAHLVSRSGCDRDHARAIVEREMDVALIAHSSEEYPDLERHELFTEPLVLVVPPDDPPPDTRRDLERLSLKLPLIRYTAHGGSTVDQHLRRLDIDAPGRASFDSACTVLDMVARGFGWSLMPVLALIESDAPAAAVRIAPFPSPTASRTFWLVAYGGALGTFPEKLANLAREILTGRYRPRFQALSPWLGGALRVPPQSALGYSELARGHVHLDVAPTRASSTRTQELAA
jgi:DNA-binding transcriptional LysR family regulator